MTYCWVDAIAGRATWPRSEADTEIMNTGRAHNPEINIYGVFCRHVIRRRWWVIAMTLIGLSASIWAAAERLTIDTSLKTFMRSDAAAKEVLDAYRAEFGRDDVFMIVVEGDVFTPLFMKRLRALHTGIETIDFEPEDGAAGGLPDIDTLFDDFGNDGGWGEEAGGSAVEAVNSLVNAKRTQRRGDGVVVDALVPLGLDGAALAVLRGAVLADGRFVDQLVSRDGGLAVLVIRTQRLSHADMHGFYGAVTDLIGAHTHRGFRPHVAGGAALNATFQSLIISDLRRMLGLCVLAMFVVLVALFRHPLGVAAPLVLVSVAGVLMMAGMAVFGMPLTLVSNILPAFLFCVGICHAVHLLTVFRDRLGAGDPTDAALVYAAATTATPIIYTSLTTIVGLLSFRFATIDAIQEMGTAGALGVFIACVLSLTLLPALLSFHRGGAMGHPGRRRGWIDRFLASSLALSRGQRGRRWTMVSLFSLVVFGVVGIGRTTVHHNPVDWIPEDRPFMQAFRLADGPGGGTANVQLLIEAENQEGVYAPALLDGLARLEAHIAAYRDPREGHIVRSISSLLDLIEEAHRALRPRGDARRRPPSAAGVAQALLLFENAAPEVLREFVASDRTRAQATIRSRWLEATAFRPFVSHIEAGIARFIPTHCPAAPPRARCAAACDWLAWCTAHGARCGHKETHGPLAEAACLDACHVDPGLADAPCAAASPRVRPTGAIYTLVNTVGNLISDLLRSFGAALVVITLIMVVLLRGPRLGLIAMVPNLLPIVVILGIMGFTEIPIDANNLLIASISIGLAVDDTIHYLHHFRQRWSRTGDLEGALNHAIAHTGRAIVSTTLILMLGFGAFMGAEMANIARFGFLVSATALIALLIDLVYAPALLRTFFGSTPQESTHANP